MDISLLLSLALILALLVISGILSGSETALTAASRARMHQMARRGNRRARIVNRLIARPDRLIGAILLGNNLVNILASSLATSIMIVLFGDAGVVYATALMTALIVIFSEVLPKTKAIEEPDRVALAVAPALAPVITALGPPVRVVRWLVGGVLHLFDRGGGAAHDTDPHDELRGTIDLHARAGAMVKTDRDMLDSILDLGDVQVFDIMVHRRSMTLIDANLPIREIVEQMLSSPFTRVPLWREEQENIVGILHAKDLLLAISRHGRELAGVDLVELARRPWFVPETTTLREQLNAFRERREHFALVVDEYGALMGLVTLEDILEEIVGEISDEHDLREAPGIRREPDGRYVVDGSVSVRDLNRTCEWDLPEDEAATVAGLLITEARRIPDPGESFEVDGFRFEVLSRHQNQITALRIKAPHAR